MSLRLILLESFGFGKSDFIMSIPNRKKNLMEFSLEFVFRSKTQKIQYEVQLQAVDQKVKNVVEIDGITASSLVCR